MMKQFLYLDTDIINSIIAQSDKGLVLSITEEKTLSESENDGFSAEISAKGTVGGSILKIAKAEADIASQFASTDSYSSSSTSRELLSKSLHDAAFDIACAQVQLHKIKVGDQQYDETGNYIELNRVFDYVDLDYLERLFDKDGIIDFIKKIQAEKIEEVSEKLKENHNREQLRNAGSKIKSEIKKAININNKQYDDVASIIRAFKGLLPYRKMLISHDGYLIPLDDKYFRIDSSCLGFKYGGEITCVGIITNIIGESTNHGDASNIFATLQFTVNETLRKLLPTIESDLCVVHPIAVYYS